MRYPFSTRSGLCTAIALAGTFYGVTVKAQDLQLPSPTVFTPTVLGTSVISKPVVHLSIVGTKTVPGFADQSGYTPSSTVADVNGDAIGDVITFDPAADAVFLEFGDGGGTFAPPVTTFGGEDLPFLGLGAGEARVQDLINARSIADRVTVIGGEPLFAELPNVRESGSGGLLPPLPKKVVMRTDDWAIIDNGSVAFMGGDNTLYFYDRGALFGFEEGGDPMDPLVVHNVRKLMFSNSDGRVVDPYGSDDFDIVFGDDSEDDGDGETKSKDKTEKKKKSDLWDTIWSWGDVIVQALSGGTSPKTMKECVDITKEATPSINEKIKIIEQEKKVEGRRKWNLYKFGCPKKPEEKTASDKFFDWLYSWVD